jgi:hypothetical protein
VISLVFVFWLCGEFVCLFVLLVYGLDTSNYSCCLMTFVVNAIVHKSSQKMSSKKKGAQLTEPVSVILRESVCEGVVC